MPSPADALALDPKRTALAVVDIQERLFGAMPPPTQERVMRQTSVLIQGARALEVPVLVTEQYPKGLGPTIAPLREVLGDDVTTLSKVEFDCSRAEGFLPQLRSAGAAIDTVILSGMEAHICVLQTAAGLLRQGYRVWVAQDAIASRADANWEASLRLMTAAGAVVAPVESALFMLLGKAGSPAFKTISALVR